MKEDPEGFKGYLRIDVDHFDEPLHLLALFLQKQDTNMRECISPEEICYITLRYLASGESESFRSLEYQFRISKKVSYIIQEVCSAMIKVLNLPEPSELPGHLQKVPYTYVQVTMLFLSLLL